MEGSDILVEVDCEEVETSSATIDRGFILLQHIVKVISGFGGDGSNLLVATGVSGDKEDGNTFNLQWQSKQKGGGNGVLEVFHPIPLHHSRCPVRDTSITSICLQNEYAPYQNRQILRSQGACTTCDSPWDQCVA